MSAKSRELTVKEAKLVKGVAQGKPKYKAAIDAGYSPKSAPAVASETLKKPNVQAALQEEMAKQGITLAKIVRPITDALEAERVHIVGSGDQAMAEVVPDHSIRLKASSMAQSLIGVKAQEGGTTNYNFINIAKGDKDEFGI